MYNTQNFSLMVERKKTELREDSYLNTVMWFIDNIEGIDIETVGSLLNKKIKESIRVEAIKTGALKNTANSLF